MWPSERGFTVLPTLVWQRSDEIWKRKLKWKGVSLQLEVATPEDKEELDAGRDSFMFNASFRDRFINMWP